MQQHQAALTAFVRSRTPALLRTAYLLAGDQQRAEDLLQTAFERLARRWTSIQGDPEPYLRRTMVNLATDRWRVAGRRVREVPLDPPGVAEHGQSGDAVSQADQRLDLVRALGRLTARQRAVLVLRYLDDLSEKDVAAALGCSVGTVKSTAARALERLRDVSELDPPAAPSPLPRSTA